jgi:5,10-methylenetetrahydromethanopterin reductase
MEVWIAGSNVPGTAKDVARRAEGEGFDGLSFGDTQCINADPFVGLTAAAAVTTTLKLGVGVTNPVTRHPAVTACAIASVQVESAGRAVLGIGRGDSAVSRLNRPAATVEAFEEYLAQLQGYLAAEDVDIGGKKSSLEWLGALSLPKVPVDVAATGPAVIAVGARLAERLTFNVGADTDRLSRNVALAHETRRAAGIDPAKLSLGAWLPVAPHPSTAAARDLVKGVTAVYARFQAMPGHPANALRAEDTDMIRALGEQYDNSRHGRSDATHVDLLDDDFIDRFAVVGPPERCIERLWGMVELGLDRLLIVGPNRFGSPDDATVSRRLLTDVVIPELRRLELRRLEPRNLEQRR